MKRIFLLAIGALLFSSSQILLNCSSPLDSSGGFTPSPPGGGTDTLYVHDTVFLEGTDTFYLTDTVFLGDTNCDSIPDTVFVTDTLYQTIIDTVLDTIIVNDTVIVYDTIIDTIVVPCQDSCGEEPMCAEFNKHNKKVYWKLHNNDGKHRLTFTATFGDGCFDQVLHIHIKDKKYVWNPKMNPVFTIEKYLYDNAKIMVHCKKTHDDGGKNGDDNDCDDDDHHDNDKDCCNVDVCLKVKKL